MQDGVGALVKIWGWGGGGISTHPPGGSTFTNKVDKEAD